MFTKEEMDFTVKEMIGHAIGLIEEFNEYEDALIILKELPDIIMGSQEKAKSYWIYESAPFGNDLDETLRHLCNPVFNDLEIIEQIFRKVLSE